MTRSISTELAHASWKFSPHRIKCKFMQDMSEGMEWGRPDEMIGFIEHNTMRTVATGKMNKFEALKQGRIYH